MTESFLLKTPRGILIPETILQKAGLSGRDIEFKIVAQGLLIQAKQQTAKLDPIHQSLSDAPALCDDDWEW